MPDDDPSLPANPSAADGFTRVDAQPDTSFLVDGMLATAQWPSVRRLRAWERERLALRPGDRLLDVGCGAGDAACALAGDVIPDGTVLALDASEAMLAAASRLAAEAHVLGVEFAAGDALALDVDDGSFDACRSERMLQWVPDLGAAVAEMVRALRPGGRLSLIDTDWRTFTVDVRDVEAYRAVRQALLDQRGVSASAGGRLLNLCRDAGLADIDVTADMHVWSHWDPDTSPAPSGFFPLDAVGPELAELGLLDPALGRRFVDEVYDAARRDRFAMSVSMVAVSARKR
jgi:SAM-dependent methyltransferase